MGHDDDSGAVETTVEDDGGRRRLGWGTALDGLLLLGIAWAPDRRQRAAGWSTRCSPDPVPVSETAQLAMDPPIAPARVLPSQPQHQLAEFGL